ncbi:hypothetical protein Tco_0175394 [Tanacetum coccineum]
MRGTLIGSGLVVTTCEESSGKVYVVRETLVKSLPRVRNLDRVWSGRYDMRGTVGESLRRARNLCQVVMTRYDVRGTVIRSGLVVTTCEEPSGKVYVMRETLVKLSRRARNLDRVWSSRYDVPRNLDWFLSRFLGALVVYDVPGTLIGSGLVYDGPRNLDRLRTKVSAQFGTVTRLPVHPASPVLLTKNGPLGALDSVARLNKAANSHPGSSYPEGNFGGNQLLDGSISLSPLYPSQTNDLHVSIAAGLHQSFLWLRPAQA